jgi:cell division protein FtsQ
MIAAVRGRVSPRRLRLLRPRPKVLLALAATAAILAGAWFWVRDSSLVSVDRVTITGVSGPDAPQIRSALQAAAHNMTTLHVRLDALRTAVAPFPVVKDLRVDTQFPHGLRIRVIEQIPVAAVHVGGRAIAVAGDGTLLHDVAATQNLPTIPLTVPPGGTSLADPTALASVRVLAAAPYQLLAKVTQVTPNADHGPVVQLRNGPSIYFGDATRLDAKWIAATQVLSDPRSAGASYIDVTDPERPAAGATQTATGTTQTGGGTGAAQTGTGITQTGGGATQQGGG